MLSQREQEQLLLEHRRGMRRLSEYFLSRKKGKLGADVPVPEQPRDRGFERERLSRLKLSQKIGLLLWLNRMGFLTPGGSKNLEYLQSRASLEALESSIRFLRRLEEEKKLPFDFQHELRALNHRFRTRPERVFRRNRIRGYRDKGTAPSVHLSARRTAHRDSIISVHELPQEIVLLLERLAPLSLEGEWVDLDYVRNLDFETRLSLTQLLV